MRLIDVESFRHPSNRNDPTAGTAEAAASSTAPETTAAFALHSIAKLLDPILQILFAPAAKILRPPLRSADTYRLGWSFRSRSVQRRTGTITRTLALATRTAQPAMPS